MSLPSAGQLHEDIKPDLRMVGFERRVTVAFTVDETTVTILRLFYGGQDWSQSFQDDAEDMCSQAGRTRPVPSSRPPDSITYFSAFFGSAISAVPVAIVVPF
jgi:hypothetical protein